MLNGKEHAAKEWRAARLYSCALFAVALLGDAMDTLAHVSRRHQQCVGALRLVGWPYACLLLLIIIMYIYIIYIYLFIVLL